MTDRSAPPPPVPSEFLPAQWLTPDQTPLSCTEKIKVLNENLREIRELAVDALEDGVLMGADPEQVRAVLARCVQGLPEPFSD